MRMGFEEDVNYNRIDQIDQDFGQNDQNCCDGQEDCENVNIHDGLRDTNNNSSSTLFSETEMIGRGRGLVAKVKLIIITITIIIMIMIMMITNVTLMIILTTKVRLPAGTLVASESPIFTLTHPALLKVKVLESTQMDLKPRW